VVAPPLNITPQHQTQNTVDQVPHFDLSVDQVPLEDDQIFLHAGELEYAQQRSKGSNVSQAYYMPDPADTYVLAFRQWMDKFGGGGPFGPMGSPGFVEAMGPRRDRSYLLDRCVGVELRRGVLVLKSAVLATTCITINNEEPTCMSWSHCMVAPVPPLSASTPEPLSLLTQLLPPPPPTHTSTGTPSTPASAPPVRPP
jgi:hypothetical protein